MRVCVSVSVTVQTKFWPYESDLHLLRTTWTSRVINSGRRKPGGYRVMMFDEKLASLSVQITLHFESWQLSSLTHLDCLLFCLFHMLSFYFTLTLVSKVLRHETYIMFCYHKNTAEGVLVGRLKRGSSCKPIPVNLTIYHIFILFFMISIVMILKTL